MHVVQTANHEYHPLLLRVPWHILRLPPLDDSCFWNPFFFSIAFFQLENPFFVNAGSVLHEVFIALWTTFKQVRQQAASLLSSWCNYLHRSNYAVWNDLFLGFFSRRSLKFFCWCGLSDTFTRTWSRGLSCAFIVSSLPANVVNGSKSLSFPGCSLARIVSSTTPDCAWSYPR